VNAKIKSKSSFYNSFDIEAKKITKNNIMSSMAAFDQIKIGLK